VEQALARARAPVVPARAAPLMAQQGTAQVYQPSAAHTHGAPTITVMPLGQAHSTASALHSVALLTAPVAGVAGMPASARELPLDLPLREARDAFERAYFEHHLSREHGSMTRVAEKTGLERTHLYRKLKQLGIDLSKGAYRKSGQTQH
jgi:DNA-binding NtrC family response regulator